MELNILAAGILMGLAAIGAGVGVGAVSYTHLTLPTRTRV